MCLVRRANHCTLFFPKTKTFPFKFKYANNDWKSLTEINGYMENMLHYTVVALPFRSITGELQTRPFPHNAIRCRLRGPVVANAAHVLFRWQHTAREDFGRERRCQGRKHYCSSLRCVWAGIRTSLCTRKQIETKNSWHRTNNGHDKLKSLTYLPHRFENSYLQYMKPI